MCSFALVLAALSAVVATSAKQINITVGANTTANGTTVFIPAEVTANIGDVVFFNFTMGNHSAIQSTFASPCIPAHDTNSTINGFNSGDRPTNNGTAITNLPVTITTNDTIWFYDASTCAIGGVGGININESSTQTLDGFRRNAIRLNGTTTSTSASGSATATSPSGTHTSSTASATGGSNSAERTVVHAVAAALPMALVALLL